MSERPVEAVELLGLERCVLAVARDEGVDERGVADPQRAHRLHPRSATRAGPVDGRVVPPLDDVGPAEVDVDEAVRQIGPEVDGFELADEVLVGGLLAVGQACRGLGQQRPEDTDVLVAPGGEMVPAARGPAHGPSVAGRVWSRPSRRPMPLTVARELSLRQFSPGSSS